MCDGVNRRNVVAVAIVVLGAICVAKPCRAEDPATVLHGTFVAPRSAAVKRLRARVRPVGSAEASIECVVAGKSGSCDFPATKIDVELYSPGLAPVYFWDFDATRAPRIDVGPVLFASGGALTGKIIEHGYGIKGVDIELAPAGVLTGNSAVRSRLKSRHAVTDRSGNYTF